MIFYKGALAKPVARFLCNRWILIWGGDGCASAWEF